MPQTLTSRPSAEEYATFYRGYVDAVPAGDLIGLLEQQNDETERLLASLPDEAARYAYAEGKWTVKEVVAHVADTERVMAYRALRFARGDATPLPGFDQDDYVRGFPVGHLPLRTLLDDLAVVRRATLSLFRILPEEALARRGTASGAAVTVRALGCIIAGHERHHVRILRERYLRAGG